jgi:hypothetical protein
MMNYTAAAQIWPLQPTVCNMLLKSFGGSNMLLAGSYDCTSEAVKELSTE